MGRKQNGKSSTFVKGFETFLASESILFAYLRTLTGGPVGPKLLVKVHP